MMGHFIISKLLLMTLLLQPSKENVEQRTHTTPEPDDSVHFGEFCLRVSDDSHWTSSESVTQLPTKSAHPTKHSTQLLERPTTEPTHLDSQSTQPTTQPDPISQPIYPESLKTENTHFVVTDPRRVASPIIEEGCRCQGGESEHPTDTSQFKSIFIRFPSESCNSTETIVTLRDNREVCVIVPNPSAYYIDFLRNRSKPATIASSDEVSFPAPLEPTTELPITTPPFVAETEQFYDPEPEATLSSILEEEGIYYYLIEDYVDELPQICEFCNFRTNVDNVDPKAVLFLNVKMQPSPCPVHVNVSLKDDKDFCLDSNQPEFVRMLEQLEIPHPDDDDDDFNPTPKNIIDGCRCKEREQKPPTKVSDVKSTKIWRPSETCSSTEFIETLMDGREVCVTAPNLLAYLGFVLHHPAEPAGEAESQKDLPTPNLNYKEIKVYDTALLSNSVVEEILYLCTTCIPFENWNNVEPKDVQSLEMDANSIQCPVLFYVRMKNKEVLCANWSQPGFRSLLEKLKI